MQIHNLQRPLAFFLATSGHSGVDRVMGNLIREIASRGVAVDLLKIRNHGPHLSPIPKGVRVVDLGTAHVNSSLGAVIRYLKTETPRAVLSDKDRVNRLLILAKKATGTSARIIIRVGTTVSSNLARRSWWSRQTQYLSIRRLYSLADAIITPSSGAARDLVRIGKIAPQKVHVLSSPVVGRDLHEMAAAFPDQEWFGADQLPVVLGVGELCARKDFSTLIKAFAHVQARRECRLVILGKGRQREKLLHLAENLGISGHVRLPGFVDNPYACMARAAVFVLSSRCEGAPVVLMEALSLGKSIVSTDCPSGPAEILDRGRWGRLVPVGDAQAMARAIEEALDHPPNPSEVIRAAAPYGVPESADGYLDLLMGPR